MLRVVWIGLLIAATALGCSRNGSPLASSSADTAPPSAPAAAPYVEGAPILANSADGVHIEYRIYGKGEPAVVLVHGWSCNENYWNEQVNPLKTRYTVVLIDLAGHGASGKNRTD